MYEVRRECERPAPGNETGDDFITLNGDKHGGGFFSFLTACNRPCLDCGGCHNAS